MIARFRHDHVCRITLVGVCACAAGVTVPAFAQSSSPDEIMLTGIVRDFNETSARGGHPDFERQPAHGFGLYAGNVAERLGPDGRPQFTGGGYRVTRQWTDAEGRPIAPSMYNRSGDSSARPADPTPSPDRVILEDARGRDAFEINAVSVTYNDDGTSTWRYRVRELSGGRDLSHWNLLLDESMRVMPGTTDGWDLGVDGSTGLYGIKWDVIDDFDDETFTIVLDQWYAGTSRADIVTAKSGQNADRGRLFAPTTALASGGSSDMGDREGDRGESDTGGIYSAESFDQWYRDVPGVNLSRPLTLRLVRQDDGSYVFDDKTDELYRDLGGFFPIDGAMYGNSDGSPDHNFHFTFELHTEFVHDADANHVFRFVGDDDVWVFINGELVIDLGGVHAAEEQFVELNRLGLVDGESYELDFFFAERHRTQSNFRIATTLPLRTARVPSITAAFD